MKIKQSEFKQRRQDLMAHMEPDSIAILATAEPASRNGDTHYPYRQNSDFFYLTGLSESSAVLVLIPGRAQGECLLFCQEKDPLKELWNGKLLGPEAAVDLLGMDDAFPISDIDDILPGLIEGRQRVYYSMGRDATFDKRVMDWVQVVRKRVRSGAHSPGEFLILDHLLHEMRLIKSRDELALLRESAAIAMRAHERAMKLCRPGLHEYELEAEFLHEFGRAGCKAPAYPAIVAGGANACILHYTENDALLRDGDLVLIDAGCEYQHYASDITRTFPANGRFSPEQKAIYELVLEAQLAAIDSVKPGNHWNDPHDATVQVITRGLLELGLLKGSLEQLIEEGAYRDFYMHRAGHWLGMDVHDVGDYKIANSWRQLEAGMVMTVEPGIYVAPDNTKVEARWRGIGVRIEDDVAVTATGHEVLSAGLAKTVAEVEALMAS